ncbi:MAG: sigma-54-dependent Fis family transcriptional regulator [candidate division Zixibacteria bacterium]|nr:sigma-54-dependent Fis family transcriptional regulator [candidate division Zixibacteria bacterium]
MTDRSRILFVEDDDSLRRVAEYNLHRAGFEVAVASDGAEGWAAFQKDGADLVVTDLAMQKLDGYELLRRIKGVSPDTEVIIITAYGTVDRAVEAMKAGAFDFVTKPFEFDVLRLTIERALERRRLLQENTRLQSELTERFRPESIIGVSAGMERIFDLISRVAPTDTNVLILGESGTGKELIARAIHYHGHRKSGPFVAVNCGALPRDLIESELFGAQRGAFTGADHDRPGRFERATGGTLFLDEITELPTDLQVKLLRALQERQIERLGGQEPIAVDVRFICASNADVGQMVATGSFRRDLYFRINVVTIQVPPLRQRSDDIEPLVHAFLERYHAEKVVLEPETLAALKRHAWPGNVRELENAIERAVVLRENAGRITVADLPWEITAPAAAGVTASGPATAPANLPDGGIDFSSVEKSLLEQALRKAGGNRSRAARLLGMSRQTLLYRLKKFGISVE